MDFRERLWSAEKVFFAALNAKTPSIRLPSEFDLKLCEQNWSQVDNKEKHL